MSRVLVAMSGGVDSSVAAALLVEAGHEVVGATLKLWGGPGDSGCCSLGDVEDARRVADRLGIEHHMFNFEEDFARHVVGPYVASHAAGATPNPCVECNRHLKFGALLSRAARLSFDFLATGHHARLDRSSGRPRLLRGTDGAKDQSYVLACLIAGQLERLLLPIGELTKAEVRAVASSRRLATAGKPDSQEVCFLPAGKGARGRFLAERIDLSPGVLVDAVTGAELGEVAAMELLTVGQRRGLALSGRERLFVLDVDVARRRVLLGGDGALSVEGEIPLEQRSWTGRALPAGSAVSVQVSAHGSWSPAVVTDGGVRLLARRRRVAPGQTVAIYDPLSVEVLGAGIVRRAS